MELTGPDAALRLAIYESILRTGCVPSVREIAAARRTDEPAIREGLSRLSDAHALVLDATGEPAMVHPFSAARTPYTVVTDTLDFRANCAWDALAIPAMLNVRARVEARCHCACGERLPLVFGTGGELTPIDAVVHFAVPPRRFYDDIRFT